MHVPQKLDKGEDNKEKLISIVKLLGLAPISNFLGSKFSLLWEVITTYFQMQTWSDSPFNKAWSVFSFKILNDHIVIDIFLIVMSIITFVAKTLGYIYIFFFLHISLQYVV